MTDPISDMITRIRNASAANKESLVLPYSKIKEAVLNVLAKEQYIKSIEKKGKGTKKILKVELSYVSGEPRISGIERISKYSRRQYVGFNELRVVKGGRGLFVLTTPNGVITDKEAKAQKVGGEIILKAW